MKQSFDYSRYIVLTIAVIFEVSGSIEKTHEDDCTTEQSTIVCEHTIPIDIPRNISGVIIKDLLNATISKEAFAHESWSSIDFFDVTVNNKKTFRLYDNIFISLVSLQNLGIHSPRFQLDDNHTNVLGGFSRLHTLNLSSCHFLGISDVRKMLNMLNYLDTLILNQVASYGSRRVNFDTAFIEMVIQKKIRRLSLSGCNLLLKEPINIAYQLIDLYDLDISNTTFIIQGNNLSLSYDQLNALFPSLKYLDASLLQTRLLEIDYGFLQKTINNYGCREHQRFSFIFRITDLKINQILSRSVKVNGSFINLSKCQINTQSLQIRSNHLHYLNVTILWPKNTPLINVDLSSNDIEYLSPSFLGSATSLEILNLSDNQLHLMDSLIEFRYLFTKHKKLRHLDISRNSIKLLPFTIFSCNLNLTTLDLSHNRLTSISFNLKNLVQLQFLNLRNNEIYHIDGNDLNTLNAFVAESSQPRVIYFEHNRFICNCKSSRFIKWLHVYMTNNYTQILTCSLNGKDDVPIDDAVIKEAEFSCIRSKVIIASVLTVVSIITLVSLAICFIIYKRRKQERMRKRGYFITNFKLGYVPEKYLCFVSYSSEDYKADIRQVTAQTKESLQELIQTSKEVLCVIDEHVNLGFPIVDEIMRCIKESCVGLFFVTTNFCQSQWCEMELRETYELNKPIILIFKEEIDTRIMSPLMLKIFQQFTRGKMVVTEHGDIQLIPDIKELSNSILKLASLRYNGNSNGNIEVN